MRSYDPWGRLEATKMAVRGNIHMNIRVIKVADFKFEVKWPPRLFEVRYLGISLGGFHIFGFGQQEVHNHVLNLIFLPSLLIFYICQAQLVLEGWGENNRSIAECSSNWVVAWWCWWRRSINGKHQTSITNSHWRNMINSRSRKVEPLPHWVVIDTSNPDA